MQFSDLPTELVAQILENVHPCGARYNCLFVSRRIHELMLPIHYRTLRIPFIPGNRLTTLVRTVRRNAHLRGHTRTLCLGEDPYDVNRSVERIIGWADIALLFPALRKVELYAMTFERRTMLQFFAYCARAPVLEDVTVHFPDLVPLVRPLPGVKSLMWSFTVDSSSPVLCRPAGRVETQWIQKRFLESLDRCCPQLERLTVGCAGRESQWGISDRRDAEYDEDARHEIVVPSLEKLKEFRWLAHEGMTPEYIWETVADEVLQTHANQLEAVSWDFASPQLGVSEDGPAVFLSQLPKLTALKKLEICYTIRSITFGFTTGSNDIGYHTWPTANMLESAIDNWQPRALREIRIRYSVAGDTSNDCLQVVRALQRVKWLQRLDITFGIPYVGPNPCYDAQIYDGDPQQASIRCWYFDEIQMTELINNLPTSLETVMINLDGQHDVIDKYQQYEFKQGHDNPLKQWDEDYRASVQEYVSQRKSLPKKLVFDRMPGLREVFIGGYDLLD
ncbi:hypothetical protein DRE_04379 [Drechslerella stenobrocha 248]|uniref:F-box domain-containing protein n=1 Tax=Drechslerella stenobrocha 248 TaxID=1043628 RepID=W7HQI5_9PEZI|nr:hypothetical protein DRE_04379 [Drechslerella stenobrocha 248]